MQAYTALKSNMDCSHLIGHQRINLRTDYTQFYTFNSRKKDYSQCFITFLEHIKSMSFYHLSFVFITDGKNAARASSPRLLRPCRTFVQVAESSVKQKARRDPNVAVIIAEVKRKKVTKNNLCRKKQKKKNIYFCQWCVSNSRHPTSVKIVR